MFGLFVCLDFPLEPLESPEIITFDEAAAAYKWAAARLVDNGLVVKESGGGFSIPGEPEFHETDQEVVEAWAYGLGGSEYFHVYECRPALNV